MLLSRIDPQTKSLVMYFIHEVLISLVDLQCVYIYIYIFVYIYICE